MAPKASILDEKLADLFAQAVGGAVDSLRDLRESVCEFVEAERARGTSLDEVISRVTVMLKSMRDGESANGAQTRSDAAAADRELAKEMVHWCNDSYVPAKTRKKS